MGNKRFNFSLAVAVGTIVLMTILQLGVCIPAALINHSKIQNENSEDITKPLQIQKQTLLNLLAILNCLIIPSYAQSGDGPLGIHNFDTLIEDDEQSTSVLVGSVPLNEITGKSDFVIEDDEDAGTLKISSPPTVEIIEGGQAETDAPPAVNTSSSGIILTVVVITLVLLSCCAWRVFLVRKKRAAKQRRSLRNHALTSNLLDHDKPYRELVEIDKKNTDINLNVGGNHVRENVNEIPTTFTTTVSIEDHEAISKRLSPPPTYDEYLRSSRDNLDANEVNRLSNLGPSYR
ncbi:unnamed protein product [Allacma fusca]|uniref:Uncharacterized protein n=1 Tax=Allacma fusca TaxID=39272 RepID=A0A8J2KNX5_9HEXA|nr:unnamed protein product [Allacma fusca]